MDHFKEKGKEEIYTLLGTLYMIKSPALEPTNRNSFVRSKQAYQKGGGEDSKKR